MILDIFSEKNTEIVFSYLPVWEMFYSMHVLSNPEHHTSRKKWVEAKEKHFQELVNQVKELKDLTNSWEIIIDSDKWGEIRQMEIVEMISFFRKKNIYQWNQWIEYTGKTMCIEERDKILDTIEQYYTLVFQKEEVILRVYLTRAIQEEKEKCKKQGIWEWSKKVHVRLHVEEDYITYMKNREFKLGKKEIRTVFATVSTFVSPHLWFYRNNHELEIVKGVLTEQVTGEIPQDFMWIFKALGDSTRMRIIKLLLQGICTTQELAEKMAISEAAVSKHLKIMRKAGIVQKAKKGFYMEYKFKTEMIDYIPYMFYETMML